MTQKELGRLSISEISPRIKKREISPVEVTRFFLSAIERHNPALNAYITVTQKMALADAQRAEKEIRRGNYRGPLHGVPFSLKDTIATRGVRTTAGSKILSEWKPDFDATVVTKLKEAGAILLGKTNMHEWAGGGTTINPFYGTTRNPWDLKRITGGSSGGSAAAVAAQLCLTSIGTDNMGSVRNPAAMCGIVGLKPTYGRISRFGDVPGTGGDSTDHLGIFTKTVKDCALVLAAVAGHDPKDPLSAGEPVPKYSRSVGQAVRGLRVGLISGYFDEPGRDRSQGRLCARRGGFRVPRDENGRDLHPSHGFSSRGAKLYELGGARFGPHRAPKIQAARLQSRVSLPTNRCLDDSRGDLCNRPESAESHLPGVR